MKDQLEASIFILNFLYLFLEEMTALLKFGIISKKDALLA